MLLDSASDNSKTHISTFGFAVNPPFGTTDDTWSEMATLFCQPRKAPSKQSTACDLCICSVLSKQDTLV